MTGWRDGDIEVAGWRDEDIEVTGWRDEDIEVTGWRDEDIEVTGWRDEDTWVNECGLLWQTFRRLNLSCVTYPSDIHWTCRRQLS